MKLSHIARDLTLLGATSLMLTALTVVKPALAAPAGVTVFGSVDINKLASDSTKKAKYDDDMRAMADKFDAVFKVQTSNLMLTKAEQDELGGLLSKPRLTDADRARITALQTESTQETQQYTDLQQKKDPTPADTAQLDTLNTQYQNSQKILQDIGAGYQAQLKKLNDDDSAAFTQNVKEAIKAVAVQKGLTVVFTADIAVYTTNDITDEVLNRLNK
jgi:Skp family chaperone for outer membrane proteins